ncbi:hypothetical protein CC80DRAFT_9655 [Byssothecium circinans]|uniref:Uncharacterized protein n=1 Tax=Byssothecium circinans TaxID=147558 RepID=A0A6A5UI09_9PLEO|nr:hypothetical protein CC80DRAFT_9655 [Byssothecium circinans]
MEYQLQASYGGGGGGGGGGSFPTHAPAPVPSHSSPQQYSSADPQQAHAQAQAQAQARLQQQQSNAAQPSFPYNQFANGQAGGFSSTAGLPGAAMTSGAMMQPGLSLHQAQAQAHAQARAMQQPSPSPYRQTATASPSSATNSVSPYGPLPTTQYANSQPTMAATPAPVTPIKTEPGSPATVAREKERIDTILSINMMLIEEVGELHIQGKTGHIGPTEVKTEDNKQQPPSSLEYRDCMRRLQANLAFLAQSAERYSKPNQSIMPGPAIMNPPNSPDELVKAYLKLQTLFPGWKGAQAKASPGPQRLNSMSSQSGMPGGMQNMNAGGMQPPNSAGLQNNMQPPNSAGLPPNMQLGSNAGMNVNMNMMGNMQHMQ